MKGERNKRGIDNPGMTRGMEKSRRNIIMGLRKEGPQARERPTGGRGGVIEELADEGMRKRTVQPRPGRIARQPVRVETDRRDAHPINPGNPGRYRRCAACEARHSYPVRRGRTTRKVGRGPMPFVAAVLLTVLAVTLVPLLFPGCSSSRPEGTVRDFIRARLEGDERRAAGLTVEGDLSDFPGGEAFLAGSGVSFDAETAEVSADRARVVVHYRWGEGEKADVSYICQREGSRWKVSLRETEELWLPDLKLLREEEEH